ncbi:hypothetical protein GQ53DRAFT_748747, partial [Thozetella sp. PMI_491]
MFRIRLIESVHRQFRGGPFSSVAAAEHWIHETTSGIHNFIFALSLRDPPRDAARGIIGVLGLNPRGSLCYMLYPDFSGQGYCTEALRAFLEALFKVQPQRHELEAWIFEDNISSRRVAEKCGFEYRVPVAEQRRRFLEQEEEDELKQAVVNLGQKLEADLKQAVVSLGLPRATQERAMLRFVYERNATDAGVNANEGVLQEGQNIGG